MLTFLLCVFVGIIAAAIISESPGTFAGIFCVGLLLGGFLGGVIIVPDYDESKTQVRYEKIIAVNGYYIDPSGDWVTDKNSRGCFSVPIPLPVDRINGDLFVRFEEKTRKRSIWSLMSGVTEHSKTLSLVSEDSK